MGKKNGNGTGQAPLALAKLDKYAALTTPAEEVSRVLQANLGIGGSVDPGAMPCIKMPTGGAQQYVMPDGTTQETFDCIVVAWHDCRAYWPGEFQGSQPPQCVSGDGLTGIGDPGGECRPCPYRAFGSRGPSEKRQACKAQRRMFLVMGDRLLPVIFRLPPTSLKPCAVYFHELASFGVAYYDCITRFGLTKASNAAGIEYSVATFNEVGRLSPEVIARVQEYARNIAPLKGTPISHDDFENEKGVDL